MVPTRNASVSRTAITLKVVARPETESEASISMPGRSGKVSVYRAVVSVTSGAALSFTACAVPLRVTSVTGFVEPDSWLPLARSVYDRTRGKSSATATESCGDPMTAASAGTAVPTAAGDRVAAAAGSAVPTSARTAAEAAAAAPAEVNLRDMCSE